MEGKHADQPIVVVVGRVLALSGQAGIDPDELGPVLVDKNSYRLLELVFAATADHNSLPGSHHLDIEVFDLLSDLTFVPFASEDMNVQPLSKYGW